MPASSSVADAYPLIMRRRRVGTASGLLLAAAFALALTPLSAVERLLGLPLPAEGEVAAYTVRVADPGNGAGRVLVARNEQVTPAQASMLAAHARPADGTFWLARLAAFLLVGLLVSVYLRGTQRGRTLQVQVAVFAGLVAAALAAKLALVLTVVSPYVMPVGGLALLIAVLVDRHAGLAAAIALGMITAALTPFDAPVAIVLSTQGVAAVLALGRGRRASEFLVAAVVGALAAAGAYVGLFFLSTDTMPLHELAEPLRSPLVATLLGGLLCAPVAVLLRPLVERATGQLSRTRLIELADLQQPLLRQIATGAPGTWQHSLAMANMAEIAANAIGANALLTRCGALYHDLGKSLQPQYYIENLGPGEPSPHDSLPPEVSADAIFSHVTEGVRLARQRGLPEPIIDFMHMHHGDGLLEYFWGKCLEQGNPKALPQRAFRYPGVPPQSRETAILCICDAVEAASRTLRNPDARAIEQLVQRIVYGKLHLGQLDESGLSVADLKVLAATLVDTLKHAHHVRVEYPWQREERARAAAAAGASGAGLAAAAAAELSTGGTSRRVRPSAENTLPGTPAAQAAAAPTRELGREDVVPGAGAGAGAVSGPMPTMRAETARFVGQLQLDSADAPRPFFEEAKPVQPAEPAKVVAEQPAAAAAVVEAAAEAVVEAAKEVKPATTATTTTMTTSTSTGEKATTSPVPESDDDGPTVPIEMHPRPKRKTIELLKDEEAKVEGDLAPGTLILGPPPATKPDDGPRTEKSMPVAIPDDGATTGKIVKPAVPAASMPPPKRRKPPTPPKPGQ